jgi:catechol 2,3-dioxygenase-like lactoylglutathione lyase family enzyme
VSPSSTATIERIANVIIPTDDQERALTFYTEVVGLTVRADLAFGPELRWIEVGPAGGETTIAICPPGPGVTAGGKQTGIALHTADADGFHARLREHGVDVDPEVARYGEGIPPTFWFRDPEGNIVQVTGA